MDEERWGEESWLASVYPSYLDERVWVPSIDGADIADAECRSSTSIRRIKAYVEAYWEAESKRPGFEWLADGKCIWVKVASDKWEYHCARDN